MFFVSVYEVTDASCQIFYLAPPTDENLFGFFLSRSSLPGIVARSSIGSDRNTTPPTHYIPPRNEITRISVKAGEAMSVSWWLRRSPADRQNHPRRLASCRLHEEELLHGNV